MKKILLLVLITGALQAAQAQTKTTEKLDEKTEGTSLYFYKNTLRMLNQKDDPQFDEMIKDIEKIRFLMIDRNDEKFSEADYKNLKQDYTKKESFEEIANGRYEGKNFSIYVREASGKVKGTIIMASDSSNVYVLDILGKIALDKAQSLFKMIDDNSDVARKIKREMDHDN
ncbi:MAG TPA: DUF4252 domain-containing protein [Cyclobacteriaceae bacterium]|nr:DUF4252 domain-containing protein [Cyclobacteriaceae bacterium]